ncbi:MAG: cation diffusion facilitator family transporter [Rickettsiaceae bacterium]
MICSHNFLIKSSSISSVVISCIILFAKIYGWFITNSQAMLASMVDSMLDISSSAINLVVVYIALQPADNNHRFGHNKFQDLAVFSQSIFFAMSGLFVIYSAINALFYNNTIYNQQEGSIVMYICIFFTVLLVSYQTYVIKHTKSMIIKADKIHYLSDLLANIAVVISIYLSKYIWFADSVLSLGISSYIIISAYKLFRKSIKNLVDEEFSDKEKQKILDIIGRHKSVYGLHELKTRYASNKPFIQFHLELDGNLSLTESHEISDQVENDLLLAFPDGEITIHQDPAGVEKKVNYREVLPRFNN